MRAREEGGRVGGEEGAHGRWEEGAFDDADNASDDNDDDNDETTTRKSLTQSCRGDPHQPTRR